MKKTFLLKNEISELCEDLALLIHGGVSSADALALVAEEDGKTYRKDLLISMSQAMDEGKTLSESFRQTKRFPDYVCSLLKVGEKTGNTEKCLRAISDYYRKTEDMQRRLGQSLLYPSILMVIMVLVILVLLVEILPIFNQVYEDLGGQLAGFAGGLLAFGQVIKSFTPVLVCVLAVVTVFLVSFALSDKIRDKVLSHIMKRNGEKGVFLKMYLARLSQGLSMCMSSGLHSEEALVLSEDLIDNVPKLSQKIGEAKRLMTEGETFGNALQKTGLMPPQKARLLELAMKSGNEEMAMTQISERLDEEVGYEIDKKISKVEPAMVLISALILGYILLSVMIPLINIMSSIG